MVVATPTDLADKYRISDPVDQLRVWGHGLVYRLPDAPSPQQRYIIGSTEDALIRIQDSQRHISRQHGELILDEYGWRLIDLNSKNGIFADGDKLLEFALIPGMEIRIGRVTLIAESPLFRGLQELLRRFIGWGDDSLVKIDVALRGIRNATLRKEPLILHAESGHISIARLLHRHLLGVDRPFIAFDPRGNSAGPHHRRSTRAIYDSGMAALEAAADGTLVVRRSRLPDDFEQMLSALRDGKASALLIVAAPVLPRGLPLHLQIAVPPLDTRMHEIGQIIDAYADDALAEAGGSFASEDREWVARQPNLSLAMIETATRRLIARRASDGDISRTAERIGRSQGATSVWFARRSELPASAELMEEGEDDDGEDDQAVEQSR